MKKLKHEAELFKAALLAGIQYAEGRKAVEFESTDSASEKALYVYRLFVHDKVISPMPEDQVGEKTIGLARRQEAVSRSLACLEADVHKRRQRFRKRTLCLAADLVTLQGKLASCARRSSVPGMCRAQIGCAMNVPWCGWGEGWQALQVVDY
jgi:hypothetical protein